MGCLRDVLKHSFGPPTTTPKCPICRAVLRTTSYSDLAVCNQTHRLLAQAFPARYAQRARQIKDITEEKEALEDVAVLPLFVLDAMLPGQRMHLQVYEPRYLSMCSTVRRFGMVGYQPGVGGWGPANEGTEVEIVESVTLPNGRMHVQVVGRRAFKAVGDTWVGPTGLHIARVRFLSYVETTDEDLLAQSRELGPLFDQWLAVIRNGWERWPRHMSEVMNDLGPMPAENRVGERAMWVAAVVNPLPPLGVAREIRPTVLAAGDCRERLSIALTALKDSIGHLEAAEKTSLRRVVRAVANLVTWLAPGSEGLQRGIIRAAPLVVLAAVSVAWSWFMAL